MVLITSGATQHIYVQRVYTVSVSADTQSLGDTTVSVSFSIYSHSLLVNTVWYTASRVKGLRKTNMLLQ